MPKRVSGKLRGIITAKIRVYFLSKYRIFTEITRVVLRWDNENFPGIINTCGKV